MFWFWLQGTLCPLIHAVAPGLSVIMVLTNPGFPSKRSLKILYCTVCANGSFAEVNMELELLLGAPFICVFQSTWKHPWGEDPLTLTPVFCPQDNSASHRRNSKFWDFKFQANPKHKKYFCDQLNPQGLFQKPKGISKHRGLASTFGCFDWISWWKVGRHHWVLWKWLLVLWWF